MSASRARRIAISLTKLGYEFLDGRLDDAALIRRLRRLATDIEGDRVLKAAEAKPGTTEVEESIFLHWQKRMTKPKAKFGSGRRRVIRSRLREGYTEEQIRQAIDACSASEFHMGDNDRKTPYNDLTHILRNGEKLEQFLEQAKTNDPGSSEPPEIQRLQREAAAALKQGDMDAYNTANARIRSFRAA